MANEKIKVVTVGAGKRVAMDVGWDVLREGEQYVIDINGKKCSKKLIDSGRVFVCEQCGRFSSGASDKYFVPMSDGTTKTLCGHCEPYFRVGTDVYDCEPIYRSSDYVTDGNGHYTLRKYRDSGDVVLCERCGSFERSARLTSIDVGNGKIEKYCRRCVSRYTISCDKCGTRVLVDNARRLTDGHSFCVSCFDGMETSGAFATCIRCGGLRLTSDIDSELGMCHSCICREGEIHSYHSSHGHLQYFGAEHNGTFKGLGIELEVELSDSDSGEYELQKQVVRAKKIMNTNGEPHSFFEHDGSLNNGFEIITAPHTIAAMNALPIEQLCEDLRKNGFISHNSGTCGLHIHFSRALFGHTLVDRERSIAKIAFFYSIFWEDILRASRRSARQADRWASRYVLNDRDSAETYAKVNGAGRYSAINLSNSRTVEFRLGRGTLNAATIRAWIDLHYTLIQNARRIAWTDIHDVSKWLDGVNAKTAAYLISRNAFVSAFNNNNQEV